MALCHCDDKRLTRRIVAEAGATVPHARLASFDDGDYAFLEEVGDVVVKPIRGEQGKGITVGVSAEDGPDALTAALDRAREQHPEVLIEQRVSGDDLRLLVIDGKVIAAAVRRPPEVIGTGEHSVRDLISSRPTGPAATMDPGGIALGKPNETSLLRQCTHHVAVAGDVDGIQIVNG